MTENIFKCDRCGGIAKEKTSIANIIETTKTGTTSVWYSLCDRCLQSLKSWMNPNKEVNETNDLD